MANYLLGAYVANKLKELNSEGFLELSTPIYVLMSPATRIARGLVQQTVASTPTFTYSDLLTFSPEFNFVNFDTGDTVYDTTSNLATIFGGDVKKVVIMVGSFSFTIARLDFGLGASSTRNLVVIGDENCIISSRIVQFPFDISITAIPNGYIDPFIYNVSIFTDRVSGIAGGTRLPRGTEDSILKVRIVSDGTGANTNTASHSVNSVLIDSRNVSLAGWHRTFNNTLIRNNSTIERQTFTLNFPIDPTQDQKQIFTDFDRGDYSLNPNPIYSSPITVTEGYKGTGTYESGENPFINPTTGLILCGRYGIGIKLDFRSNNAIGYTQVPVGNLTFADIVQGGLPSELTRDEFGIRLSAPTGATVGTFETVPIYLKYGQASIIDIFRRIELVQANLSPNEYLVSEARVGTSSIISTPYKKYQVGQDDYFNVFSSERKFTSKLYVQLRFTLGRW